MSYSSPPVRVRFAPAPTGMMHLGNARTALMNYLFAQHNQGTFILRVEDTDPKRNFDPNGVIIQQDLAWLGITFDEGPEAGGSYGPYLQSARSEHYHHHLKLLQERSFIYRCFCTNEILEQQRERQRALGRPPRYDRTCMQLSPEECEVRIAQNMPFVWRFRCDHTKTITVTDLARGTVTFELKNFSDFPLTRSDGSFTFIFANFVDDLTMKMTHVLRGEDHLTNTAEQAALYGALDAPLPTFWHMPILCSLSGKKLSKRDFGFSLNDLRNDGFLPEAIVNYLAILGASLPKEIASLDELVQMFDVKKYHSTSHMKFDPDKLRWVNKQWILSYPQDKLVTLCRPHLEKEYSTVGSISDEQLGNLITHIITDIHTLNEPIELLKFCFETPEVTKVDVMAVTSDEHRSSIAGVLETSLGAIATPDAFMNGIKQAGKEKNVPTRELFQLLRLSLTGAPHGLAIPALIDMLGAEEATTRIAHAIELLKPRA